MLIVLSRLKLMNKVVLAGIVAGVLIAGLIFNPVFTGQSHVAQAGTAGNTKKVVQVAAYDMLHPGGTRR
jgi:hypothetical protein